MQDRDTKLVDPLYDFSKAKLIWHDVALLRNWQVNSADKLYLVIESVRRTRNTAGISTAPVPVDGAGGLAVR
jgi:hypothetical protein